MSKLLVLLQLAGNFCRLAAGWIEPRLNVIVFLVGLALLNVGLALVDLCLPFLVTGPLLMLLALAYALLCVFFPPKPPATDGSSRLNRRASEGAQPGGRRA